nr:MAG TPA: hypothetical protein [Caudoviricetes sp.]
MPVDGAIQWLILYLGRGTPRRESVKGDTFRIACAVSEVDVSRNLLPDICSTRNGSIQRIFFQSVLHLPYLFVETANLGCLFCDAVK